MWRREERDLGHGASSSWAQRRRQNRVGQIWPSVNEKSPLSRFAAATDSTTGRIDFLWNWLRIGIGRRRFWARASPAGVTRVDSSFSLELERRVTSILCGHSPRPGKGSNPGHLLPKRYPESEIDPEPWKTQDRNQQLLTDCIGGGAEENRTLDLLNAIQALSQLSYGPTR